MNAIENRLYKYTLTLPGKGEEEGDLVVVGHVFVDVMKSGSDGTSLYSQHRSKAEVEELVVPYAEKKHQEEIGEETEYTIVVEAVDQLPWK